MHGDLCKHLGIDSSTDHPVLESIPKCLHKSPCPCQKLKNDLILYPLGIWHVFIYSIYTNIYHFRSMKYRQYALMPANRRIHLQVCLQIFHCLHWCTNHHDSLTHAFKVFEPRHVISNNVAF